ncbi:NTTRR-F1 domain [Bacillus carboniphilus]|uniref:NTTRR-F1 domain n=1 Tax=Bacillus carboniphilus TaxID=86663 RepID=A0ABY9K024_9BACI|nr:NTTRR-F1 domain [Bacillus carboniphilus]WLR43246.1 NTTRR-F1 domain [Bacillus carboniphilus]
MTLFQNLIVNGRFQLGELSPWTGENACVIDAPCPIVAGQYSAALKSGIQDASIEQLVNVIQGESYQLILSLASNQKGTSPSVLIDLEYLNSNFTVVENGIELVVEEGQLPNGKDGNFSTIIEDTTTVPQDVTFARLKIRKIGSKNTTGVIVDNVILNRVETALDFNIPCSYVGNTGEESVSVIPNAEETIELISGNPVAMQLIGNFVYVANGSAISVIDITTNTLTDIAFLELFIQYVYNRNILTNSDQSKLYVCAGESNDPEGIVAVIDTSSNTLEALVTVGIEPVGLALTSDDETLYVVNKSENTVSVIDTNDNTVTASFTATAIGGVNATFLQVTPDDSKLIIGYDNGSCFEVYNIPDNTFNQSVEFPEFGLIMRSIGTSLDGTSIYIGAGSSSIISDPSSFFFLL